MAASPEGVIGKDNNLLWNHPDELAYFKQTTKGQVIIMGRKTFEALPASVFLERTAIVFSKNHPLATRINHQAVSNLDDFREVVKSLNNQQFFMVGGAQIAHLFFKENLLTEFFLTKINQSYLGDTYLDFNFFANWPEEIINSSANYTIMKLTNPNGGQNEFFTTT